jgi:hypothetical protein
MKLNGVTRTIAVAWAGIFGTPRATSPARKSRLAPSAIVETSAKRRPWSAKRPRSFRNVQRRFQV